MTNPIASASGQRARHREVVDGAVYGQLGDVAAGEEQRPDDVAVGRQRESLLAGADRQQRAVAEQAELGIAKLGQEHVGDQRRRGLAARSVRQRDMLVVDPRRAPAAALDPIQNTLIVVHASTSTWVRTRPRPSRP